MVFKKIVSVFLMISLMIPFSTVQAAEISQSMPTKTIFQNLYTADGEYLGKAHKTLSFQVQRRENAGVEVEVTENNEYDLEPEFASIRAYKEKFSNGVKVKAYFITNDNKVYENGKFLVNFNDLSHLLSSKRFKRDSGGIPNYCHYYDDGKYNDYTFKSYSAISWSWSSGASASGNHIEKVISSGNSFFNRAKSAVDSFQSNFNTVAVTFKAFAVNLVAAGYSIGNIPALILSGVGLGVEAIIILNNFDNAKDDIESAYNYIDRA